MTAGNTVEKGKANIKIIIIGGVAAGTSAAVRARRMSEDAEIVIYEKYKYISYATCGLPYYVSGIITDISKLIINNTRQFEKRFNISVKTLHEVIKIDPANKTINVKEIRTGRVFSDNYDKLIIATGSSPVIYTEGLEGVKNVFMLRTIDDSESLKEYMFLLYSRNISGKDLHGEMNGSTDLGICPPLNAVILGGGYIGLELIEAFLLKGFKITVIEKTGQLLPMFDYEIIEYIENYLLSKGVKLLKNEEVKSIQKDPDGTITSVITAGGSRLPADLIFIGTGTKPDISLAEECGLEIGQSGAISVNEFMQTSDPDIFAAGDCCECTDFITGSKQAYNLAFIANMQGRCAGSNAAGAKERFNGSIPTSIIKILDISIAKTGLGFSQAKKMGIDAAKIEIHYLNHAGYYPGAQMIHMLAVYEKTAGTIIGFEAIGYESVDKKLDTMSVAIRSRMKIWELSHLNLGYHPAYGSAKDSLNIIGMIGENLKNGLYDTIDAEELKERLAVDSSPAVIDVRTKREFEISHIEGAVNIPVDELRSNIEKLDRDSEIVLLCRTSYRSYLAYRILKNNGFKNVKNLNGSYMSMIRKL
ncbi:MAG: Coenzyme A disulfide reductase [Actinobacteria bacterium ADurb.Bin346]|nr:MAG: Coenzyme A disulfide reductase [Actinobacteria bacterium ADurb.Bin346]